MYTNNNLEFIKIYRQKINLLNNISSCVRVSRMHFCLIRYAPCRRLGFNQNRIKPHQFFQKTIVFLKLIIVFKDIKIYWLRCSIKSNKMLFKLLCFGESCIGGDQLFQKNSSPRSDYATFTAGDVVKKMENRVFLPYFYCLNFLF